MKGYVEIREQNRVLYLEGKDGVQTKASMKVRTNLCY